MDKKVPAYLLVAGISLAMIISGISLLLYGKVYFFDGYDFTKFLWVVSIGCTVCGFLGLFLTGKAWIIGTVVLSLIILFVSCNSNDSGYSGSSYGNSSYRGSSGYYGSSDYRCNNCGGDGWDSANGCSCVWCGGDGRTSWNP